MKPNRPTQVLLSIDTEFSIAGHFQNAEKYQPVAEPVVYGHVNGKDEGLGFLLDTFNKYNTKVTFFVECANYFHFGDEPMHTVVQRIKGAEQDVQLHVHPIWLHFNKDEKLGVFPQNDDCNGRSYDDLRLAFEHCIDVFERWVGRKPKAIRTGSLVADDNVYRVMSDLGIPLSSNLALGLFTPKEPELALNSGRHLIHGVMELPVFTYRDMNIAGKTHQKSLQITSCSWPEMKHLLWKARRMGVENVVILTHPFEYFKKTDFRYDKLTRNRVNQKRLEKLCAFLQQNPDDFSSSDFSEQHEQWATDEIRHPDVTMPSHYAVVRKLHNKLNDTLWGY
ncbi:MAG: hypothetical protein AB8C02_19000 [Halioglobus sp.]